MKEWVEQGIRFREKKTYDKAFRLFQLASKYGDIRACSHLIDMYEKEEGVVRDQSEVVRLTTLIKEAAEQAYPVAQCALGIISHYGYGNEQRDEKIAIEWFRLAVIGGNEQSKMNLVKIANGNNVQAQYVLGQLSFEQKDIKSAIYWFRLAALLGDERAKANLEELANEKNSEAQNALGKLSLENDDYQTAVMWFQLSANQACASGQCNLGFMYQHGNGVLQDYEQAISWYRLSALQGYASGQCNLGFMYQRGYGVAQDAVAATHWYRLAAINGEEQAIINLRFMADNENSPEARDALSRLGVSGESGVINWSNYDPKQWYCKSNKQSHHETQIIPETGIAEDGLLNSQITEVSPGSMSLETELASYQFEHLLGSHYVRLLGAVQSLRCVENNTTALEPDHHSHVLASLHALLTWEPLHDQSVTMMLESVLVKCLPVYRFLSFSDVLSQVIVARDMVINVMDVLNHSDWLLRYRALVYLTQIRTLYDEAIVDLKSGSGRITQAHNRVSLALLGAGYYHVSIETARGLMCIDEKGVEVKHNRAGSHAVCAADGVHYKPNLRADAPINPGKEYAVSSLMQLLAGSLLAAAPSTLLSIGQIPVVDTREQTRKTGGLVQAGLTIAGLSFQEVLSCQAAVLAWQERMESDDMTAALMDLTQGFAHALIVAKAQFPNLFTHTAIPWTDAERGALSEALRLAFEKLCEGKSSDVQLRDVESAAGRPEGNRRNAFRGIFEGFWDNGGALEELQILTGLFYQYPALMRGHDIVDVLQQMKHLKRLTRLFPKLSIADALKTIKHLLTPACLEMESFSALWVGLLLTLPCDAKSDNFIFQIEYDIEGQVQRCRIVAIDNDLSLKMPLSVNEHGQLCLEIKNTLLGIPSLMEQPLHPVIRKRLLSSTAESQFLMWLCLLARRDSDYQLWQAQGVVTKNALAAVDIPVQLPEQVWLFIKMQWGELQCFVANNPQATHRDCFVHLYPLIDRAYEGLKRIAPTPLAMEQTLYQFFKIGGNCPVERLIELSESDGLPNPMCTDPTSPMVSCVMQCKAQIDSLDWNPIPVDKQWPLVEALALLPTLTVTQWQGKTKMPIMPFLQVWFQEAVSRGSAFVARRLLELGASVSLSTDKTRHTALHHFCRHYLHYPDSKTVRLMAEVLFTHHSCQPNTYNGNGYTPLLQWVNATPEPHELTSEQAKGASIVLDALVKYGANLEAKDGVKHETALDKTVKRDSEKVTWFVALVERGAGVHANGVMIVQAMTRLAVANRADIKQALSILKERNLSVAWALGQRVWTEQEKRACCSSGVKVYGTQVGEVSLPTPIAKCLLTDKQEFNSKGEKNKYGRRIVKTISHNSANWHVKEHPEMPGVEQAVNVLARLLFGEHTPPSELFSFYNSEKMPYPVLISQTVLGENLQTVLNDKEEKLTEKLDNLHPQYLSEQIILAMLIHPEDGKPDNYQLVPMKVDTNGAVRTMYRIVGVDNDHGFVNPVTLEGGRRKLHVKSVLFCLEMMRKPVSLAVRERLLAIKSEALLEKWLSQLIQYQEQSSMLFDRAARNRLFNRTTNALKAFLGFESERLPVVITIPFHKDVIAGLWDRLNRLQFYLRQNPLMTHLRLLKAITPALGIRYEEVFNLYSGPYQVKSRFHHIAQDNYSLSIAGRYGTLTTSREALSAMGLSDKAQSVLINESDNNAGFTPQSALNQLRELVGQNKKLVAYRQAFLDGNVDVFKSILSEQLKADMVKELDFGNLVIPGTKKPDLDKQTKLLNAIVDAKLSFQTLMISHCAGLTNLQLDSLLKNSPELTRLTLLDCPNLTDRIILSIKKYTPHIVSLTLMQLSLMGIGERSVSPFRETDYIPIELSQLKRINISDNLQLTQIAIECSQLVYATLRKNPLLSKITITNQRLDAMDVSHCGQLTDVALKQTLNSSSVLPRLNLEGCYQVKSGLLHAVSANCPELFSIWGWQRWEETERVFKNYLVNSIVYVDCQVWNERERELVFILLGNNSRLNTLLVNVSNIDFDNLFSLLCECIANNPAVQSICIYGGALKEVDKKRLLGVLSNTKNKRESDTSDVNNGVSTDMLSILKSAVNHSNPLQHKEAIEILFDLYAEPSLTELKSGVLSILSYCQELSANINIKEAVSAQALHYAGSFAHQDTEVGVIAQPMASTASVGDENGIVLQQSGME